MLDNKTRKLKELQEKIEFEINQEKMPKSIKKTPNIKKPSPQEIKPMEPKQNFEERPDVPYNQKITAGDWNTNIYNIIDLDNREKDLLAKWNETKSEIDLINASIGKLYDNVRWQEINIEKINYYQFKVANSDEEKWNKIINEGNNNFQLYIKRLEILSFTGTNLILCPNVRKSNESDGAVLVMNDAGTHREILYKAENGSQKTIGFNLGQNDHLAIESNKIYIRKKDAINVENPTDFLDYLYNQFKYHSEFSKDWGSSSEQENAKIKQFLNLENWINLILTEQTDNSLKIELHFNSLDPNYRYYFQIEHFDENGKGSMFVIYCNIDIGLLRKSGAKPSEFYETLLLKSVKAVDFWTPSDYDKIELYQTFLFSLFTNIKSDAWNIELKYWSYKPILSYRVS